MLALALAGCGGGAPAQPPAPMPVIFSAGPAAPLGLPGTPATFQAEATEHPTSWDWTFGAGLLPAQSASPQPTGLLNRAGTHQGSVVASNVAGSSIPFTFDYSVPEPQQGVWIESIFDSDLDAEFVVDLNSAVVQERIIVVYQKLSVDGFFIALSGVISGSGNPGAWTRHHFNLSRSNPVTHPVAHEAGIGILIAQGSASRPPSQLLMLHCPTLVPNQITDWVANPIIPDRGANRPAALLKTPTGWMVAAETGSFGGPTNIAIYRTSLDAPTGPDDWSSYVLEADTPGFGSRPRLLMYQGKPVLHFDQSDYSFGAAKPARIALATIADPAAASDWVTHTVVDNVSSCDLTILHDRLAMVWMSPLTQPAIRVPYIRLQLARHAFPQSAADWDSVLVKEFGEEPENLHAPAPQFAAALTVSAPYGRLLIAFRGIVPNFQDPYLLRATAAFPESPADWDQRLLVADHQSSGLALFEAHAVNGRIATVFNSPKFWTAQISDGPW